MRWLDGEARVLTWLIYSLKACSTLLWGLLVRRLWLLGAVASKVALTPRPLTELPLLWLWVCLRGGVQELILHVRECLGLLSSCLRGRGGYNASFCGGWPMAWTTLSAYLSNWFEIFTHWDSRLFIFPFVVILGLISNVAIINIAEVEFATNICFRINILISQICIISGWITLEFIQENVFSWCDLPKMCARFRNIVWVQWLLIYFLLGAWSKVLFTRQEVIRAIRLLVALLFRTFLLVIIWNLNLQMDARSHWWLHLWRLLLSSRISRPIWALLRVTNPLWSRLWCKPKILSRLGRLQLVVRISWFEFVILLNDLLQAWAFLQQLVSLFNRSSVEHLCVFV